MRVAEKEGSLRQKPSRPGSNTGKGAAKPNAGTKRNICQSNSKTPKGPRTRSRNSLRQRNPGRRKGKNSNFIH